MLRIEEVTALLIANRLPLTAFVAGVTRDFHLAEDVFQEVCVKAVAGSVTFESSSHLIHWARMTGKNRAIDIMRVRDGRYQGLSEEVLASLSSEWPLFGMVNPLQEALSSCLETITPNNRELLKLRYFEQKPCDQVAQIMGRKIETVYQALSRLHKSLGDCIRARLEESGQ